MNVLYVYLQAYIVQFVSIVSEAKNKYLRGTEFVEPKIFFSHTYIQTMRHFHNPKKSELNIS